MAAAVLSVSAISLAGLATAPSSAAPTSKAGADEVPAVTMTGAQMMAASRDQATAQLAAELGVDVAQAARLMAAQEGLKALDHSADGGFVELRPHYTPDALVVKYLSTSASKPAGVMRQLGTSPNVVAEFITVPFTIDELLAANTRARETLGIAADSTIDPERGAVVLITAAAVGPETAKAVEVATSPVAVTWQVDELSMPTTGGGGAMTTCTGGFTVKVVGGTEEGISTAGHCPNTQSYQGIPLSLSGEASSGNADVQWMDSASFNWSPDVWLGSSPNWPVQHRKNWDNAGINDSVCRYGMMTGGCGILLDKWFTPGYITGATASYGLMSGTTATGGDSGGPVYYGNTAWGLHSGHTGSGRNIFTPHDRLSTRMGVQVMIQ